MIDRGLSGAVRTIAVLLVAGFALGGCGLQSAGTAVEVGDTEISVSDIEAYVDDYKAESGQENLSGQQAVEATRAIVERRLVMALLDQLAPAFDVTVTEAELSQQVQALRSSLRQASASERQQFVAQQYVTDETLVDSVRWNLIQQGVIEEIVGDATPQSEEEYNEIVGPGLAEAADQAGISVEVNPRYGAWEWDRIGLVTNAGQLVEPNDQSAGSELEQGQPAP